MAIIYETLKKELYKAVIYKLQGEADVEIVSVTKNNGVKTDAISIKKSGEPVSSPIALETFFSFYVKSKNPAEMAEKIVDIFGMLIDYKKVKKKIYFKIVNRDMNEKVVKNFPHRDFLDLVILYYVRVKLWNDFVTIPIGPKELSNWNVTEHDLWEQSNKNMEKDIVFRSMSEVIAQNIPSDCRQEIDNLDMDILRNSRENLLGAGVIALPRMADILSERYHHDVYLIPSSIHEWIIYKDMSADVEELQEMIQSVNDNEVLPQEVLSDHPYKFIYKDKAIKIA